MKRLAPLLGLLLAAGATLAPPPALATAVPPGPAASGPALPDPAPAGCCGTGGAGDLFGGGFTKEVLLGPGSHRLDLEPGLLALEAPPLLASPEDGTPETRRPAEPRTWTLVLAGLGALLGIAGRRA